MCMNIECVFVLGCCSFFFNFAIGSFVFENLLKNKIIGKTSIECND